MKNRFSSILLYLVSAALWLSGSPTLADCNTDRIDQHATVSYVADGDTVKLDTGEWIRLIGINTPELGHDRRPDEPLAKQARTLLFNLLAEYDMHIQLRLGSDRRDRHGRLLAHTFLPNGRHLGEILLEEGLGFHVVVPGNLWAAGCLRQAEHRARQAGAGIWAEPYYASRASTHINPQQRGFLRIQGKVVRIGHSRKATWLNLEGNVALRVANRDLPYFQDIDIEGLLGKTLAVRGWFYRQRGELRTSLRHPHMLEAVTP